MINLDSLNFVVLHVAFGALMYFVARIGYYGVLSVFFGAARAIKLLAIALIMLTIFHSTSFLGPVLGMSEVKVDTLLLLFAIFGMICGATAARRAFPV